MRPQALERLIPAELSAGLGGGIDAAWLDPMLSRYYAAWAFVEYGLFLALCYAAREALGDTIGSRSHSRPPTWSPGVISSRNATSG